MKKRRRTSRDSWQQQQPKKEWIKTKQPEKQEEEEEETSEMQEAEVRSGKSVTMSEEEAESLERPVGQSNLHQHSQPKQ